MTGIETASRERVEQIREDAARFRRRVPDSMTLPERNKQRQAERELRERGQEL